MEKNCDNCYWRPYRDKWCIYEDEQPEENTCSNHDYECCECGDRSEYKYKGKYYCSNCLLKEFHVEESTVTHYYLDGEYLGSDEDLNEVIKNISEDIKEVD